MMIILAAPALKGRAAKTTAGIPVTIKDAPEGLPTKKSTLHPEEPKIQFVDSGILSTLANVTPTLAQKNRDYFGNVLECFVYGELRKHMATAESDCQLLYYRDHDQYEVDFIIENAAGNLVEVEVKAAATVTVGDFRGLKRLSSVAGEQLKM